MKWIRKIGIILLTLVLIDSILALVLSISLKYIIINNVLKNSIFQVDILDPNYANNSIIEEKYINEINSNEKAKKILDSKEMNILLEKYLDITINSISDDNVLKEIELEKDINDFIVNNKDKFNDAFGIELTSEMINEISNKMAKKEMSQQLINTIVKTKESIPEEEKKIIIIYQLIVSNEAKIIEVVIIITSLILLIIIQRPHYKVVKNLSEALCISGIGIIIFSYSLKIIMSSLKGFELSMKDQLAISGLSMIIEGIVLMIIYLIINKKRKEKEVEINEISQNVK